MCADGDALQSEVADEAERGARVGLHVVVAEGEGLQSGALCDGQRGALRETLVPDLDAFEREAAVDGEGTALGEVGRQRERLHGDSLNLQALKLGEVAEHDVLRQEAVLQRQRRHTRGQSAA